MRSRSRTLIAETDAWQRDYAIYTGTCEDSRIPASPIVHTGVSQVNYSYESMQDVETPNFYEIKAKGGIVNSPMTKNSVVEETPLAAFDQVYTLQQYGCTPKRWYDTYVQEGHGTIDLKQNLLDHQTSPYLDLSLTDYELGNLKALAITEAWGNISHNEVMSLVSVAELDKTVSGIGSLLRQVLRITTAVKRKDLKKLRNSWGDLKRDVSFDDLSDIYMQARYGLRPLYYEIRGLLKAVKTDLGLPQGNRFTFRGHASDVTKKSSDLDVYIATSSSGKFEIWDSVHQTASLETNVRAGVLTQLDELTANKLGGVDMIAESALELVPYSFIAGWFCNVADFVSSWAPNIGSETLASWVTVDTTLVQTTIATGSFKVDIPDDYKRCQSWSRNIDGTLSRVTKMYERIPEPSRPILPRLEVALDPLKLLDLVLIGRGIKKNANYARQYRL